MRPSLKTYCSSGVQGHVLARGEEVRQLEVGHVADHLLGVRPDRFQLLQNLAKLLGIRNSGEAPRQMRDRMECSAPDQAAQSVHHVLHPDAAGHLLPKALQHPGNAGITVVVRHRQHVQMNQVAGDDLTDRKEMAQDGRLLADLDAGGFLHGQNRRGHVRDRADPADARDDVADLVVLAADQEAFEEPGRLEDLQLQKRRAVQLDRQSRFAFHPRHVIDFYFCTTSHRRTCPGFHSTVGSPNSVNRRKMSSSLNPILANRLAKARAWAFFIGPQQP